HTASAPQTQNWGLAVLALFSPLNLFSMMIGAGLTGVGLAKILSPLFLPFAAGIGSVVFTVAFVRPVMGFFMRFASEPAKGLEGS
ncbi:hypothetical protein ABTP42_19815, partial [Acinetobacter baumannii]